MSAGVPSRRRAVSAVACSSDSGELEARSRSGSVAPGETVLTVMPRGPNSYAATLVNCSRAALLAQ